MQGGRSHKLKMIYGIAISAFTVAIAVAFIILVSQFYYSRKWLAQSGAGDIYTQSLLFGRLKWMLIPCCIYIVAAVAGYFICLADPTPRARAGRSDFEKVMRLKKRIPVCDSQQFMAQKQPYIKLERIRYAVWIFCGAYLVLASVMSFVYLFDSSHFPAKDFTAEILAMLKNVLPWLGSALLLCVGATVFEHFYGKSQLARVKTMMVLGKGCPTPPAGKAEAAVGKISRVFDSEAFKVSARLAVLALGVVFVTLGIFNDGIGDVFKKAINICTECIGLG